MQTSLMREGNIVKNKSLIALAVCCMLVLVSCTPDNSASISPDRVSSSPETSISPSSTLEPRVSSSGSPDPSPENSTQPNSLSGKKLNIPNGANPFGIFGNIYVYSISASNNNDTANDTFYKYDIENEKNYEIGTIENTTSWSFTYALVGSSKIYITIGTIKDGKDVNLHCELDLEKLEINVLSEDSFFPALINIIPVNESEYIEDQAETIGEGAYRYYLSLGNSLGEKKNIITKERNPPPDYGEMYVSARAFKDKIYTLEYTAEDESWLCVYDLEGKELSRENLPLYDEFITRPDKYTGQTNDNLWSMDVFGEYFYFSSLMGNHLLLKKIGSEYQQIDILSVKNMYMIKQSTFIREDQRKILFRSTENNSYYLFNLDTETLEEAPVENQKNIIWEVYDGKRMVYITENKDTYFVDFDVS